MTPNQPHISRSPVVSVGHFRPGSRGGWLPRASRARAIKGWGPWNPNAIRVSNRILVLVDSISPWDRPCSRLASIASRCLLTFLARWMKAGSCDRRAQVNHLSSACLPSSPSWRASAYCSCSASLGLLPYKRSRPQKAASTSQFTAPAVHPRLKPQNHRLIALVLLHLALRH